MLPPAMVSGMYFCGLAPFSCLNVMPASEAMLAANEKLPAWARSNFTTYHDAAGNLWMKCGEYGKAAAHFETVLAAVPDHASAKRELEKARAKMAEARVE